MNRKPLWVVAVLLLLLSTACGSPATPVPTTTLAPTPMPTPSGPIPTGSFKADHAASILDLKLKEDGTFEGLGAGMVPTGTYPVSGNHVTFTETAGICVGKPGEYIWSFKGSALTFQVVHDDCSQRAWEWPHSSWVKEP